MTKLYVIRFAYSGDDPDVGPYDSKILGYFATQDAAMEVYKRINPQTLLSEKCTWMPSDDIQEYTRHDVESFNNSKNCEVLTSQWYEYNDNDEAYFCYWIEEIHVVEKIEEAMLFHYLF